MEATISTELTNTNELPKKEVKSVKHKPMIMNGIVLNDSITTNNVDNLDAFLEKEKNANKRYLVAFQVFIPLSFKT